MKEANESEMIGKSINSLDVVSDVYNEYAFRLGFSIRYDKLRRREGSQEVCLREFVAENKVLKGILGKMIRFAKQRCRSNHKARSVFYIEANEEWACKEHDMIHNHELLLEDKVHELRSHKKFEKAHVNFFQKLRRNGMEVSHAYQLLRNEDGVHHYLSLAKGMRIIVLQMKSRGLYIGAMPII